MLDFRSINHVRLRKHTSMKQMFLACVALAGISPATARWFHLLIRSTVDAVAVARAPLTASTDHA